MKYTYSLRIHTPPRNFKKLNELLNVVGVQNHGWTYQIIERENDKAFDFITEFLEILKGKELDLLELGIAPGEIEFWMFYEYEGQCNMEFSPHQMKMIGEKGFSLCISCYESGAIVETREE